MADKLTFPYFLGSGEAYQSAFQSEDSFESYRVYRQWRRRGQTGLKNPLFPIQSIMKCGHSFKIALLQYSHMFVISI